MNVYVHGYIEKNGKVLLLLRNNARYFDNHYGLIGGKVEPDESIKHALLRELKEEIGITVSADNAQLIHCLSFKNEQGKDLLNMMFKITSWSGKIINKETTKHSDLQWFALNELPTNIIPRHRQAIELTYKNIMYSENGW